MGTLLTFTQRLLRKWILWLFAFLDAVGLAVHLLSRELVIPSWAFFLTSAIGVFWAAYQVYRDLAMKTQSVPQSVLVVRDDQPGSESPEPEPELFPSAAVELVQGNQYEYELQPQSHVESDNNEGVGEPQTVPAASARINVRLKNDGDLPFNLISATGDVDMHVPFHFLIPQPYARNGEPMEFPIQTVPTETILYQLHVGILPFPPLTEAQFAAGIREIVDNDTRAPGKLVVDAVDTRGTRFQKDEQIELSLLPLCDLYIEHWRAKGDKAMVELCTGTTTDFRQLRDETEPDNT